jgi:hypothetical protein
MIRTHVLRKEARTMDELLEIGSAWNWITPGIAFLQDLINGPGSHFGITMNAGWDKGDIRELLTRHGVRVWGLMPNLSCDMLMFAVPKTQAKWAYYLLKVRGVPVSYAPAEVVKAFERRLVRKAGGKTPFDALFDFLDRLAGDRF